MLEKWMHSAPQPSRCCTSDSECCEWSRLMSWESLDKRETIQPVEPMAPATVEADLGGDAGAAAAELEAGCWGEEKATLNEPHPTVSSHTSHRSSHTHPGACMRRDGCIKVVLGSGIISTAVELVILVFVSSTRWYS